MHWNNTGRHAMTMTGVATALSRHGVAYKRDAYRRRTPTVIVLPCSAFPLQESLARQ